MVVFGQKEFYSGKSGRIRAKWLCSGKVIVIGQGGCIREKRLYSGKCGCIRAKMVLFGQRGCLLTKMVVFGQN